MLATPRLASAVATRASNPPRLVHLRTEFVPGVDDDVAALNASDIIVLPPAPLRLLTMEDLGNAVEQLAARLVTQAEWRTRATGWDRVTKQYVELLDRI